MQVNKMLKRLRRQAIKNIMRVVKPYLHGSGFCNGTKEGVMLVVLKRERKLPHSLSVGLQNGIRGFTDYGVIDDAAAGGLSAIPYEDIAVEDLLKLERIASKLTADSFKP